MIDAQSIEGRIDVGVQPAANFRLFLVSGLAAIIGLLAGIIAYLLYNLIAFFSNLFFFQKISLNFSGLQGNTLGWWVIIVPALGGLVVGIMAKYGTSKIKGHGIPEAMEAVLTNKSKIAPRVAILKPISAAIAIGTGGPFGAEGPIIQTGGAVGSLIGQVLHTTASERKVLLACGAAGGMAATFSTPIAAVILAIELLLFEFKSRSFIPLVISSTLATSVHYMLLGRGPMFTVGPANFDIPNGLPFYLIFGLICGLAAVGFSRLLYLVEDLFELLPFDSMWWPAIGGLGLGIIGLFFPRVLGVGYDTITAILNNQLPLTVLLGVLVFKSLALLISLGSGTSGGLLAPMFMGGAALGGSFAILVDQIFPAAHLDPAAYALVGMAAVFGAASRATFTLIIFAFEITRDYNAILPLMLVCVVADGVSLLLMRNSIMTEKLARRGLRVHQEYEADLFQQLTVNEAMQRNVPTINCDATVQSLADAIAKGQTPLLRYQALPITDEQQRLVGIITLGDVFRALEDGKGNQRTVIEAGNDELVLGYPDETLHDAVAKMLRHDVGRLPVVSRDNHQQLVGYLGRAEVMGSRSHRLHEEHTREPGWIRAARRRNAATQHKNHQLHNSQEALPK